MFFFFQVFASYQIRHLVDYLTQGKHLSNDTWSFFPMYISIGLIALGNVTKSDFAKMYQFLLKSRVSSQEKLITPPKACWA